MPGGAAEETEGPKPQPSSDAQQLNFQFQLEPLKACNGDANDSDAIVLQSVVRPYAEPSWESTGIGSFSFSVLTP